MSEITTVFVTVGTTRFDALIGAIESDEVLDTLAGLGYERVLVQYGHGQEPFQSRQRRPRLALESYRFKPSLQADFEGADLVISHAGFGCLIESLNLHKPVVAVTNAALMDDHQTEIAAHLERQGYAVRTTPDQLASALQQADFKGRTLLPKAAPEKYAMYIDKLLF